MNVEMAPNSSRSGSSKRKGVPSKRASDEIRKYQRTTNLLIPKMTFSRLVRETQLNIAPDITRWQSLAILALQEAAEAYMVNMFENTTLLANHGRRVTVMVKDLRLWLRLKE